MVTLQDFYKLQNIRGMEGHSQGCKEETEFLKNIISNESITTCMEIGFNAGHSAETLLSSNNKLNLISFDIGHHSYINLGKQFIDKHYPDRHELIIGDSLTTVPEYSKKTNKKFDVIFIDGGHDYKVAKGDIINCKKLAHEKTIVIMDDTMNNKQWINSWNRGPNLAWKEAKEMEIVSEIGSRDFSSTHGLSWGYYL